MRVGAKNLITDVPGLQVGNAHCDSLKSGVTVLSADSTFTASVDIMGGAPGTREVALLEPDKLVSDVNALVLSGGSALGLDAASGVANSMLEKGIGLSVGSATVPIVPSAILFDLLNGGDKNWQQNPYGNLGSQAFLALGPSFELGSVGAGCGAFTASVKGGLGSASVVLDSGVTIGALVAVNAHGDPIVPDGPHFWAAPFEIDGEFGGLGPSPNTYPSHVPVSQKTAAMQLDSASPDGAAPTNTTIAIIATDATLTKSQLKQFAVATQDGFARSLMPSHTLFDGDLIFSVSTSSKQLQDDVLDVMALGHAASVCMARAVAKAVFYATPKESDILPTWKEKFT